MPRQLTSTQSSLITRLPEKKRESRVFRFVPRQHKPRSTREDLLTPRPTPRSPRPVHSVRSFLLYPAAAQGGHPSGCQHSALLAGGTFSTPSPGDRTQGPESTPADQRETIACAWSSSGGELWLPAPWTRQLNRASPPSLRSWQALLPLLQWLSRTHGGVAHGWKCAQSTLGAGESVTAPSAL